MTELVGEVVAVNLGKVRSVAVDGETVRTAIWRAPVPGRVRVLEDHLEDDETADHRVHAGPEKAVYAYPSERYPLWDAELGTTLGWGAFGENLTVRGVPESELRHGDRLLIGEAEFRVTTPRLPCRKLGIRFGDPGMIDRFLAAGRSGFYLGIVRTGSVGAGDPVRRGARAPAGPSIAEVFARRSAAARAERG